MTKHELRDMIRDTYAAHMRWFNVVSETNISTDIDMFYLIPRAQWNIVCGGITLRTLRAQYDILNASP